MERSHGKVDVHTADRNHDTWRFQTLYRAVNNQQLT